MSPLVGETAPTEEIREEALHTPIPDLSGLRKVKEGYREWPIGRENSLFNEEVVGVSVYGLAGQSYYSRPNAATGEPIAEVSKKLYLRKSLAEKLANINQRLKDPTFTKFFGGPVELYIEDAYRPYDLQKKLYEQVFPHLIWQQNPGITDEQLDKRLHELIAEPGNDENSPSPHATGGAVDVILRYKQNTSDYVEGSEVYTGHIDGDTSPRVLLDYFEIEEPKNGHEKFAQRNRRAFYAIMTGEALGFDTQLQVNPTEFWHWSYGDQMWAKLQGKPAAFYGLAQGQ